MTSSPHQPHVTLKCTARERGAAAALSLSSLSLTLKCTSEEMFLLYKWLQRQLTIWVRQPSWYRGRKMLSAPIKRALRPGHQRPESLEILVDASVQLCYLGPCVVSCLWAMKPVDSRVVMVCWSPTPSCCSWGYVGLARPQCMYSQSGATLWQCLNGLLIVLSVKAAVKCHRSGARGSSRVVPCNATSRHGSYGHF